MLYKLLVFSVDPNKERNLYRTCICFSILIKYCLNHTGILHFDFDFNGLKICKLIQCTTSIVVNKHLNND